MTINLSHRSHILALFALVFLSSPPPARAATDSPRLDRGACAALVAGQAADAISSFVSQARGGVETNPVLGRGERPVARIIVAKSAAIAIEAWLMRASADRGYRTFAKVIGYAAGGLGAAYAVKNINGLR